MQDHNQQEDFQARAALYALGALSQAETQAFTEEMVWTSDAVRVEVAELEAVVAQIGLSAEPATPSDNVRAQLLAVIAKEPRQVQASRAPSTTSTHLDVFANEGQWVKLFEGGYSKVLFTEPTNGYITSLLKLDPGARLPNHNHKGNEQCMVMSGEIQMNGRIYRAGDFSVALNGTDHLDTFTTTGAIVMLVSPPDYEFVTQ